MFAVRLANPKSITISVNLSGFLTKRDAWAGSFDELLTLNEPRGDAGSAVLVFGHGLYNASVALLLCEMLELGWRSKRDVLAAPLEPGGLLLVSSESVRYFDAPAADE